MRPLSYRQLKEALNELTDEQLDMTVTIWNTDEAYVIMDYMTVENLPNEQFENQDMDDSQPLLIS